MKWHTGETEIGNAGEAGIAEAILSRSQEKYQELSSEQTPGSEGSHGPCRHPEREGRQLEPGMGGHP